jgi:hypothetical protein
VSDTQNDARVIAAVAKHAADEVVKQTRGTHNDVQIPADTYVSILRALTACADGRHTEALQRLADVWQGQIDDWRRAAK